jgi:hypothetical protein
MLVNNTRGFLIPSPPVPSPAFFSRTVTIAERLAVLAVKAA